MDQKKPSILTRGRRFVNIDLQSRGFIDSHENMNSNVLQEIENHKQSIIKLEGQLHKDNDTASSTSEIQTKDYASQNIENQENTSKYKKYFCVFCKNLVDHFARHLTNKHKDENEVLTLMSLEKNSTDRKKLIAELRGKGSLIYNTTYELNQGHLIVARRRKDECRVKATMKPCIKCFNYFSKGSLWRHYRYCTQTEHAPRDLQSKSSELRVKYLGNMELCNDMKNNILPGMVKDKIYHYLITDEVILEYGNYLCNRHKIDKHLTNMIRMKLRQITKLTLSLIELDPTIKNLDESLTPRHYDTFVKGVNIIAGFNDKTFKSPSLVGEVGRGMKVIANRQIIHYIKEKNKKRKKEIEEWLHLYIHDYYHNVGKTALMNLQRRKWGKIQLIPVIEDVISLNQYINDQIKDAEQVLKIDFNAEAFSTLNKFLMTLIQLFNRKRGGEIQMFERGDFDNRHGISRDSAFYLSLSPSEQAVCSKYVRVETRGKLHLKPASILLTAHHVELINLILYHRKSAGVLDNNPYIFGKKDKFFQACDAIREAAYASDAKHPDLLTGTLLRKQIATTAQALNFTENDMTNLAAFLGHDIKTHRNFYRIPNGAIHLAKISRLLMAMDDGTINKFQGKSLDEIEVNVDLNNDEEIQQSFHPISHNISRIEDSTTAETTINLNDSGSVIRDDFKHSDDFQTPARMETSRKLKKCHDKVGLKTPPKKANKVTWSTPERHAAREIFKTYLDVTKNKLPTPLECRNAIKKNKVLQGRTVGQLKGWIFSERNRMKNRD